MLDEILGFKCTPERKRRVCKQVPGADQDWDVQINALATLLRLLFPHLPFRGPQSGFGVRGSSAASTDRLSSPRSLIMPARLLDAPYQVRIVWIVAGGGWQAGRGRWQAGRRGWEEGGCSRAQGACACIVIWRAAVRTCDSSTHPLPPPSPPPFPCCYLRHPSPSSSGTKWVNLSVTTARGRPERPSKHAREGSRNCVDVGHQWLRT